MTSQWMLASILLGLLLYAAAAITETVVALHPGRPRRAIWLIAMLYTSGMTLYWIVPHSNVTRKFGAWPSVVSPESRAARTVQQPSNPLEDRLGFATVAAITFPVGTPKLDRMARVIGVVSPFLFGSMLLVGWLQHRRARRSWVPMELHGHRVLLNETVGPALIGLLRAEIVLPLWVLELDEQAQQVILAHEAEHRRAWDHWMHVVAAGLLTLMAWHPIMWLISRRIVRAIELDCDARVVSSGIAEATYAAVLLEAFQRRARWNVWVPSPAMAERASGIGQRIEHLLRPRPRRITMKTVAGLTLVAAFTSLTAMVPAPQAAQPLPRNGTADSASLTRMKSALRALVGAEEAHYADRGTYTTDMTALRTIGKLPISSDSVWVKVIFAGGGGWTGAVMFRGMAKVRCVIYVGNPDELPSLPKTFGQKSPSSEGAITCDTP